MPAPIDFYFDFSSPYSYIAGEWVDALAARHGRTVRRQAILLGATFQAAELKSPVSHPIKREYSVHDFARSARFEGVPYQMPPIFPIPTQNAARVFWWLADTRGDHQSVIGNDGGRALAGVYIGRTRHIHVKVQPSGGRVLTTQLYFPGESQNRSDGLFRKELLVRTAKNAGWLAGRFDFVVE